MKRQFVITHKTRLVHRHKFPAILCTGTKVASLCSLSCSVMESKPVLTSFVPAITENENNLFAD